MLCVKDWLLHPFGFCPSWGLAWMTEKNWGAHPPMFLTLCMYRLLVNTEAQVREKLSVDVWKRDKHGTPATNYPDSLAVTWHDSWCNL